MFYEDIRIKQGLSNISIYSIRILYNSKGNEYTYKVVNSIKTVLPSFWKKWVRSKAINLLPRGAIVFLLEQNSLQKGSGVQERKQKITEVVYFVNKTADI